MTDWTDYLDSYESYDGEIDDYTDAVDYYNGAINSFKPVNYDIWSDDKKDNFKQQLLDHVVNKIEKNNTVKDLMDNSSRKFNQKQRDDVKSGIKKYERDEKMNKSESKQVKRLVFLYAKELRDEGKSRDESMTEAWAYFKRRV